MPVRNSSVDKLLDAVDELVFTSGIQTTPIDVVLARAGVSTATLYRGFRSKESLIAAALQRRQQRWREVWDRAIDAAEGPEQRLLAVFDAIDEFALRPGGARWCAFLGAAAEYPDPPAEIAQAVRGDTDHLRRTLQDLAADLPCDDADALAESILVVVTGELGMRLRNPDQLHSTTGRRIATTVLADSLRSGG